MSSARPVDFGFPTPPAHVTPAAALRFMRTLALRILHGGYPMTEHDAIKLQEAADVLQRELKV